MPILHPVPEPRFNITRLSHIEFGVTDLAVSKKFYVDTLGLLVTEEDENTVYLRGLEERNHHSFVLTKSDSPVVYRMGFKMASEEDLDLLAWHCDRLGLPIEWVERHAH